MRKFYEAAKDIKSILNNIENAEECNGETLVEIDELVNEMLTIRSAEINNIVEDLKKLRVNPSTVEGRHHNMIVGICIDKIKERVDNE